MTACVHRKSGAALVIVLGFLAVLTVIVLAFSTQMRTERLAGRAFLDTAQTRQLLDAALARAMEEIDLETGSSIFPSFLALESSAPGPVSFVADAVDFGMADDYLPLGDATLAEAYRSALDNARWQTVSVGNDAVGRIGYVIVNTSGLLDANHAGGLDASGTLVARGKGESPAELQLAPELLRELTDPGSATGFLKGRIDRWRRFETLRDLAQLNRIGTAPPFEGAIGNFSVFSFFPEPPLATGQRYMGSTEAEISANRQAIADALDAIGLDAENQRLVLAQLLDYVDADSIPRSLDYGVEPVPLINEVVLECHFAFTPVVEETIDAATGVLLRTVKEVVVTNSFRVAGEAWYPFALAENRNAYRLESSAATDALPRELFGEVQWMRDAPLPPAEWRYGDPPAVAILASNLVDHSYTSTQSLFAAFEEMADDFGLPEIRCIETSSGTAVDAVEGLGLPLANSVDEVLLPAVRDLVAEIYAAAVDGETRELPFAVGRAVVDPRLNWSGGNTNLWIEVGDNGAAPATLGGVNSGIIDAPGIVETPDPIGTIHVRNEGIIESPYEFTYFLYDRNKPWRTFQFFRENDRDNTRFLADHLATSPVHAPGSGWINPNSLNSNVLATAFLGMPVGEFTRDDLSAEPRVASAAAYRLAQLVMDNRLYGTRKELADRLANAADYARIDDAIEGSPWKKESLLRNGTGLFDPRDTLFAVLLVAQNARDADHDGQVGNGEVQSTQRAIAYVWRDPATGEAACVFWGLADTLQSSIGSAGTTWGTLLETFRPYR